MDSAFAPKVYRGSPGPRHVSEGGNAKDKGPPDRYLAEWGSAQDKVSSDPDASMQWSYRLCIARGSHEALSGMSSHWNPSMGV